MDVFVELVLPLPKLVIFGAGIVALALAELSGRFDFDRWLVAPDPAQVDPLSADKVITAHEYSDLKVNSDYLVIATQGSGDLNALRAAVTTTAHYVGFVGSANKFATLAAKLSAEDPTLSDRLGLIDAPAGLSINALTPEEIALSILSRIIQVRRARDGSRTAVEEYAHGVAG